jgi:hypothetical protein
MNRQYIATKYELYGKYSQFVIVKNQSWFEFIKLSSVDALGWFVEGQENRDYITRKRRYLAIFGLCIGIPAVYLLLVVPQGGELPKIYMDNQKWIEGIWLIMLLYSGGWLFVSEEPPMKRIIELTFGGAVREIHVEYQEDDEKLNELFEAFRKTQG